LIGKKQEIQLDLAKKIWESFIAWRIHKKLGKNETEIAITFS